MSSAILRAVRVLCLGEALVDLVCERHVAGLGEAEAFVPHPGGAAANTAVAAARHGAEVELAGGAGADRWGEWLRDRLAADGVGLEWFSLVEDAPTAVAFVTVAPGGEPSYSVYGAGIHAAIAAVAERLPDAVEACGALFLGSNTLVEEDERAATLAARDRALELGRPIVYDPNLRLDRWPHPGRAVSVARECVRDAFLVKCNREEARLLTGEDEPERAAASLLAGGARHVVITLGAEGAMLRGELRTDAPGVPARVLSTVGAGDVLAGVLLAHLARTDFYPAALAAALREAVAEAARATERWSAI